MLWALRRSRADGPILWKGEAMRNWIKKTSLLITALVLSLMVLLAGMPSETRAADAGKYTLTFTTSQNMYQLYFNILDEDFNVIVSDSMDEYSTTVESYKTYERVLYLDTEPMFIFFSGMRLTYTPEGEWTPTSLNDTMPEFFEECSDTSVYTTEFIMWEEEFYWGKYSISHDTGQVEDSGTVLTGDELDGVIVRFRPRESNGYALNILNNGEDSGIQDVVHLYNIGDSSRFLLTKADDESYYIDYYDGSGHFDVADKRIDINEEDGYYNEGSAVCVNEENKESTSKRWQIIRTSSGFYQIKSKLSGLYWALEDDNTDEGNVVVQKSFDNRENWVMEVVLSRNPNKNTSDLKSYDYYSYQVKDDGSITACNWMGNLDDDLCITDLSIPGTHDAGTAKCNMNYFSQCQQHTILEQLYAGVRYFDIRLELEDNDLYLTHNGYNCYLGDEHLSFSTVQAWVDDFLRENPDEAIIFQVMIQGSDKEDAEKKTIERIKSWSRTYWGEGGENPILPSLGDLRGKVMFISRMSNIDGLSQSSYVTDGTWYALDAQDWQQGSDYTTAQVVDGIYYELWTQDKYSMTGSSKMDWIEGSIFGIHDNAPTGTGAQDRRDDILDEGKNPLIVCYTSCTMSNPQSAARHVHKNFLPMLKKMGGNDHFVGIVCNDFADENLCYQIYRKNFEGIHLVIRGMSMDGQTTANELHYHFDEDYSVGNYFALGENANVIDHFETDTYEVSCWTRNIPSYYDQAPNTLTADTLSDHSFSFYDIPEEGGSYVVYVLLVEKDTGEESVSYYSNTDGNGDSWNQGSDETLDFTFKSSEGDDDTFERFEGIQVDGEDVEEKHYDAEAGSVIIRLKPSFLETLKPGWHTLTAFFDDGNDPTVYFAILPREGGGQGNQGAQGSGNGNGGNGVTQPSGTTQGASSNQADAGVRAAGIPETGDAHNTMLLAAMLALSFLCLAAAACLRRRSKTRSRFSS